MSASSPGLARELAHSAREGLRDAGRNRFGRGHIGARDGTLSIMVGGEEDDFERARPLFEVMGKTVVHVGATGAGQVVKACNHYLVVICSALGCRCSRCTLPDGISEESRMILRPPVLALLTTFLTIRPSWSDLVITCASTSPTFLICTVLFSSRCASVARQSVSEIANIQPITSSTLPATSPLSTRA